MVEPTASGMELTTLDEHHRAYVIESPIEEVVNEPELPKWIGELRGRH
jgi:hypothetical protein